jgi:ATP-dependent Lhr-like helicase
MAPDATEPLEKLADTPSAAKSLAALPAPVRAWFQERFGTPTAAQRYAWPAINEGKNLLLSAPTGTGKTLAAFLPILATLCQEEETEGVHCIYVAPYKALVNDLGTILEQHASDLQRYTPSGKLTLSIASRTGDTKTSKRNKLWRTPPALLLTTPESLAVLLSRPAASDLFARLRWIVVDEIHAMAGNKRGADLSLSLERLAAGKNPIQRVGLSATCPPHDEMARFLVGCGRACSIASVPDDAPFELTVEPLSVGDEPAAWPGSTSFMKALVTRLEPVLASNRITIVFTNRRSVAEKLAWALRRSRPEWADAIGVHHSSLSVERRERVEKGLREGRIRVVASSCTLELGLDIGSADFVVLVHPPGGVAKLLQRIGRAGHEPGKPRRGLVLTSGPAELLDAAVTAAASRSGQAEPVKIPWAPLDVLCQHIVGMAAQGAISRDDAFELVQKAYPYHELGRKDFDACLGYLSGRDQDGNDWLPPRLCWDGDRFRIADERTVRLLRRNLGSIITEEPRRVRLTDDSPIGEVEDDFAERLLPGDRFLLEGRCLEVRRNQRTELIAEEVIGFPVVPKWSCDSWPLSRELATRLSCLRARAGQALRESPETLAELLREEYHLDEPAVFEVCGYFERQERTSEIPAENGCLVEAVPGPGISEYYLHTPLNRAGNDALCRVVTTRLARTRRRSTSIVADLGFALYLDERNSLDRNDLVRLLCPGNFDDDLAEAIEKSADLREQFRRVALTGLMLLRNPDRRRRVGGSDWAERRLFEQVRNHDPEFLLIRQARKELSEDRCDTGSARAFVETLAADAIRLRYLSDVSQFAEHWTQREDGPMEALESTSEVLQRLHAALILPEADCARAS